MFTFFDVGLIIIITSFTLFGYWHGLLRALTSLIAFVFGTFLASKLYEPVTGLFFNESSSWEPHTQKAVVFIALFFIITRILDFVFDILENTLGIVTKFPIIKSINKLFGLVFGFIEGIVTAALIVYILERYPLGVGIMDGMAHSTLAPFLSAIAAVLMPLLPHALKALESTVDYARNIYLGAE